MPLPDTQPQTKDAPLRVLQVTPIFLPSIGGMENVVANLSSALRAAGVESDVAVVGVNPGEVAPAGPWGRVFLIKNHGSRLVGLAPALGGLLDGYDLLHVHDPQFLGLTANVALFGRGLPKAVSTHGGFRHTGQKQAFKALHERLTLRGMLSVYDRVLASSGSDLDYFGGYSSKVALVENGVDVSSFLKVQASPQRSALRWIYWGRLARNKRLDQVIETVAEAHRRGFPVELLIAGPDFDGLKAGLVEQVAAQGLGDAITFRDALSASDLATELQGRGVFITASEHEGFGLGVIEALAAGLVVLCREIEPLTGFVRAHENGAFVDFDDAASLDPVLDWLSMTPAAFRETGDRARASVMHFGWETRVRPFLDAYGSVLAEHRARRAPRPTADTRSPS